MQVRIVTTFIELICLISYLIITDIQITNQLFQGMTIAWLSCITDIRFIDSFLMEEHF